MRPACVKQRRRGDCGSYEGEVSRASDNLVGKGFHVDADRFIAELNAYLHYYREAYREVLGLDGPGRIQKNPGLRFVGGLGKRPYLAYEFMPWTKASPLDSSRIRKTI